MEEIQNLIEIQLVSTPVMFGIAPIKGDLFRLNLRRLIYL